MYTLPPYLPTLPYLSHLKNLKYQPLFSSQVIRGNSVVMLEALERIGGDRDR